MHDEKGAFSPKENAIADWLVADERSACIHPWERDPGSQDTQPDAMVRRTAEDRGTVTEFKTLEENSHSAVQANLKRGTRQIVPHDNGDVVVDGRPVGLDEENARRGYARFVGERASRSRPLPQKVTIILGDGRGLTWRTDA